MLKRIALSIVGGAGISLALGLAMKAMISAEFEAQEKPANLAFEVNPAVEDLPIRPHIPKPDDLKPIEVPPPPPIIEQVKSQIPDEPIADWDDGRPVFVRPVIDTGITAFTVDDRDAEPLFRVQPSMPTRADRSGHCRMVFDVSAQGKPYNVSAVSCSQSLFRSNSIKAVQKWNYQPKIHSGQAVARQGVVTRIVFQLAYENGNLIPE